MLICSVLCLGRAAVEGEDLIGVPHLTVEEHLVVGLTEVEEEGYLHRCMRRP